MSLLLCPTVLPVVVSVLDSSSFQSRKKSIQFIVPNDSFCLIQFISLIKWLLVHLKSSNNKLCLRLQCFHLKLVLYKLYYLLSSPDSNV